jgi:hypothetical protein
MSVFKSEFSRALEVIPSNYANIPYPATVKSGITTGVELNQLVDTEGNFINAGVRTGDIVYNTSAGFAATVVSVTSATVIVLNTSIFGTSGENYTIYQASPQTSNGNPGCNIYVGSSGGVKVTTIGQDVVTFPFVPIGTVLPVQVVKVHEESTVSSIVALW